MIDCSFNEPHIHSKYQTKSVHEPWVSNYPFLESTNNFNKKKNQPAGGPTPTCYVIDWHWTYFRRQQARHCEKKKKFDLCILLLFSFNLSMFIIFKERIRRVLKMFHKQVSSISPQVLFCMLDHYCSKYWPDSVCWVGLPTAINIINKTFELLNLSLIFSYLASCLTGSDRASKIPLGPVFNWS